MQFALPAIDAALIYTALAALLAYLIGSLSFAVIVSRCMGLHDPRTYGSGNPGATNVLRSGNTLAALLTLLLDAFKGWLVIVLIQVFGAAWGLGVGAQALAGLAAFMGHLWPVFFKFKGGKGVATAAGALLGLHPWLGLTTLLVWGLVAAVSRYSSLAALVAAVFAPCGLWWLGASGHTVLATTLMGSLLIWRHAANIQKLLNGAESKLGQKTVKRANTTETAETTAATEADTKSAPQTHQQGAKP
jgi:acyl phosphate:glycerol-3-phosphate acyltransferase